MINGVSYYKHQHIQGLCDALTPDLADELLGSKENLEGELGRISLSPSVGIAEDHEGYYFVVDGVGGEHIPSKFNGWRVVNPEEREFSR